MFWIREFYLVPDWRSLGLCDQDFCDQSLLKCSCVFAEFLGVMGSSVVIDLVIEEFQETGVDVNGGSLWTGYELVIVV